MVPTSSRHRVNRIRPLLAEPIRRNAIGIHGRTGRHLGPFIAGELISVFSLTMFYVERRRLRGALGSIPATIILLLGRLHCHKSHLGLPLPRLLRTVTRYPQGICRRPIFSVTILGSVKSMINGRLGRFRVL